MPPSYEREEGGDAGDAGGVLLGVVVALVVLLTVVLCAKKAVSGDGDEAGDDKV
jgi:hypothetical protein